MGREFGETAGSVGVDEPELFGVSGRKMEGVSIDCLAPTSCFLLPPPALGG